MRYVLAMVRELSRHATREEADAELAQYAKEPDVTFYIVRLPEGTAGGRQVPQKDHGRRAPDRGARQSKPVGKKSKGRTR